MPDPHLSCLELLERLSQVAPGRCRFFEADGRFLQVFVGASAFGWRSVTQPSDDFSKADFIADGLPFILYAVLEEAALHRVMWFCEASRSWGLENHSTHTMHVWRRVQVRGKGDTMLEREVLPRLECLVLMLEKQAQE